MMILRISVFLLLSLPMLLTGQKIVKEQVFKVNYPLSQVGYPKKLVRGDKGGFAYVEWWSQGEGRTFPNFYMQSYNSKIEEEWFRPVTKQNTPKLDGMDVLRMKSVYGVTGYQYSPTAKCNQLKMQMFSLAGQEKGALVQLSMYDKKSRKGYLDETALSPDSSKILWMGHNPAEKANKRRTFFQVFGDNGTSVWSRELTVPHIAEKYRVKQALTDNRGHLYLLLEYETFTNTPKDTANLPWILRYDYREKKFAEHKLKFPGTSVPEISMHVNAKGELIVAGILADGSAQGFSNGLKAKGAALKWNRIMYKKFNVERELHLAQEAVLEFPETMLSRYTQRGSDFSEFRTIEQGTSLFWIMEEAYTQIHNGQNQFLYYDVAVVAIDMDKGAISWASAFEKKQRDYNNGQLLSFTCGLSGDALRFVYLTERGAQGKVVCTNMKTASGTVETVDLALNKKETYSFFPRRSTMISPNTMVLLGTGDPLGNEYRILKVEF